MSAKRQVVPGYRPPPASDAEAMAQPCDYFWQDRRSGKMRNVVIDDLYVSTMTPTAVLDGYNRVADWRVAPERILIDRRAAVELSRHPGYALDQLVWEGWSLGYIPIVLTDLPVGLASVTFAPRLWPMHYARTLWACVNTFVEPCWRLDEILREHAQANPA